MDFLFTRQIKRSCRICIGLMTIYLKEKTTKTTTINLKCYFDSVILLYNWSHFYVRAKKYHLLFKSQEKIHMSNEMGCIILMTALNKDIAMGKYFNHFFCCRLY